jgi:type VI secretion system secreted protein Hcp
MAVDAFLKIEGIPGESTDSDHKDWIEVLSFGAGISQPTSAVASTAGGATSGRANFQDLTITKLVDKATPKLALACADGTHIKEITLELYRAGGGSKVKYMTYKLRNCIVSSWRPNGAGNGGGLPQDDVSFNFGKVEWTYTQQKRSDGAGGGNVATGWDLETNKKV